MCPNGPNAYTMKANLVLVEAQKHDGPQKILPPTPQLGIVHRPIPREYQACAERRTCKLNIQTAPSALRSCKRASPHCLCPLLLVLGAAAEDICSRSTLPTLRLSATIARSLSIARLAPCWKLALLFPAG